MIRDAVARQEALGLRSVTDGEFRRDWWHLDFLTQLDGVAIDANPGLKFGGPADQPPIATVVGKVRCSKPIMVGDFEFLASVARATPKMTIPSPSMLHLRGGRNAISAEAYPDLDEFWTDVAAAYRVAIAQLARAGCTYFCSSTTSPLPTCATPGCATPVAATATTRMTCHAATPPRSKPRSPAGRPA